MILDDPQVDRDQQGQVKDLQMYRVLRRLGRWGMLIGVAIAWQSPLAAEEYHVQPGDVLEVTVIGIPDLTQKVPVEINGEATFPLIGELQVKGMAISKVRALVRTQLSNTVYRNRGNGIDASSEVIAHQEVSVRIASYRPIYVTGHVLRPGELIYRPGMTVEQAISAAGGHDPFSLRAGDGGRGGVDILRLQGERAAQQAELAREEARIWRLNVVLGKKDNNAEGHAGSGGARRSSPEFVEMERAYLQSFRKDHDLARRHLKEAIARADKRLKVLKLQSEKEEQSVKLDQADVARVNKLYSRRVISAARISEVRRAALLSASRALQTTIAAENERKELANLSAQLERLDSTMRLKMLDELALAVVRAKSLRHRLDVLEQQLGLGGVTEKAVVVTRQNNGTQNEIVTGGSFELRPGDVVRVLSVVTQ